MPIFMFKDQRPVHHRTRAIRIRRLFFSWERQSSPEDFRTRKYRSPFWPMIGLIS